jgi:hypothetical protein
MPAHILHIQRVTKWKHKEMENITIIWFSHILRDVYHCDTHRLQYCIVQLFHYKVIVPIYRCFIWSQEASITSRSDNFAIRTIEINGLIQNRASSLFEANADVFDEFVRVKQAALYNYASMELKRNNKRIDRVNSSAVYWSWVPY